MNINDARSTLEQAYKADVAAVAEQAAKRIAGKKLTGDAAVGVVFDLVSASTRCLNVGQAMEALIFSDHDRAIFLEHGPSCGCLDWSEPTVWSHFAAHAMAQDVMSVLAAKYRITLAPRAFRLHGSPDGLVS